MMGDIQQEPDQIDIMNEDELRTELKDHLKAIEQIEFFLGQESNLRAHLEIENKELKAENERMKGGWISVDDRLPKERQEVMTCDIYDRIYHCTYRKNRFKLMFHCDDHSKVTHWQPLPQPPTSEYL